MKRRLRYGEGKFVLAAMRAGATLQYQQDGRKSRWWLSNGTDLSPWVVKRVLASRHVTASGDDLFDVSQSQTFIYAKGPLARGPLVQTKSAAIEGRDQMKMSGFVRKYLKVTDIPEGGMILHVADAKEGSYGKPELVFETGEVLSLNVTNNITLIKTYGDDSDAWVGKKIEMVVGKVEYKGDLVDAVLVRPITPGLTDAAKTVSLIAATSEQSTRNGDMDDGIPF